MRITDLQFNRLKILKAIRRAEGVSRTDLAEMTGLSAFTITEVVVDLVKRGILTEEKPVHAGKGRPRLALRFNPQGKRVVGTTVSLDGALNVAIVNLQGEATMKRSIAFEYQPSVEQLSETLAGIVEEVITASAQSKSEIECVGVSLPAIVDTDAGVVHWLMTYAPGAVPMADIMSKRLDLPVVIDNDFNAFARAEHWFGTSEVDDFCIVGVGIGITFSRYANGALRVGAHGMNGEFAHVKVTMEGGRQCFCGARGCLAAYTSMYGVVAQVYETSGKSLPPIAGLAKAFAKCVTDARAGDRASLAAFDLAGKALGVALANHVNVSDPGRIIIVAMNTDLVAMISEGFEATLGQNTLPGLRSRATLEYRAFDLDAYSRGAAALALQRLYET